MGIGTAGRRPSQAGRRVTVSEFPVRANKERLDRYFRDVAMYSSHVSALQANQATYVARAHFGRPTAGL
jgi:hypothetical protein